MTLREEATSALEILGPELDELFKLFHPDTYGGATVSYTHLTLPTIYSV